FRNADQSPYPFFPLLPALLRVLGGLGTSEIAGAVALNGALLLAALAGVDRLMRRHFPDDAATLAVWALALSPFSGVFSLVYPEAVIVAASVWAFVFVDEGTLPAAGALVAVCALARPN